MNDTVVGGTEQAIHEAEALLAHGEGRAAIELLTTANRAERRPELERALVRMRVEGCATLGPPRPAPGDHAVVPGDAAAPITEITAAELSSAAVRDGFARSGCVLVRGLVPAARAARLAAGVDATYEAFDAAAAGDDAYDRTWFWPFPMPDVITPDNAGDAVVLSPDAPLAPRLPTKAHRRVTREGAGIWTVESPHMLFEVFELVDDLGLGAVMTDFLGERPFLSANKCTLRKVPPEEMTGGWHQDGAFLGKDVGAVNCWIALSPCGVDAPGIDVVTRRFDRIVEPGSAGAYFKWSLSDDDVEAAAAGSSIVRPVFEAGDALLFDHRLVHRTGTSPEMTLPRHAIESWWFAPSSFPPSQLPLLY